MFPTLPLALNLVLSIIAFVALAGGVFGFFKSSAGDRTLKLAGEEISLLNQRDERRQAEFESCKSQLEIQKNTITMLTDTVTGASALKELAEQLRKYHEEMVDEHRELVRRIDAGTRATEEGTRATKARGRSR